MKNDIFLTFTSLLLDIVKKGENILNHLRDQLIFTFVNKFENDQLFGGLLLYFTKLEKKNCFLLSIISMLSYSIYEWNKRFKILG